MCFMAHGTSRPKTARVRVKGHYLWKTAFKNIQKSIIFSPCLTGTYVRRVQSTCLGLLSRGEINMFESCSADFTRVIRGSPNPSGR